MKKLLLLVPLAIISTGAVKVMASPDKPQKVVQPMTKTVSPDSTNPVEPAPTQSTVAPVIQPTTTTDIVPTGPVFGEDSPGQYVIYDKQAVLDGAGVPVAEQAEATNTIQRVSNWHFGNFVTLCIQGAGPSSLSTGEMRLSQAQFGPSVFTDAVTQLKWCMQWMTDHQLGWGDL